MKPLRPRQRASVPRSCTSRSAPQPCAAPSERCVPVCSSHDSQVLDRLGEFENEVGAGADQCHVAGRAAKAQTSAALAQANGVQRIVWEYVGLISGGDLGWGRFLGQRWKTGGGDENDSQRER